MKLTAKEFENLTSLGLQPAQHPLTGFSEACFDMNSAEELVSGIKGDADETDMKTWGLTEDEWRHEIRKALETAMADYLDYLEDAE